MKKHKIASKALFMLLLTITAALLPITRVLAAAGDGTNPTGGSCSNGWWDTCYGYSWQVYRVTKDFGTGNSIYLHTSPNTGDYVYMHSCEKDWLVYNYGFEVYNSNYLGYQVSTQSDKKGKQADHYSVAKGALNNGGSFKSTIGNYTKVEGYSDMDSAKIAYAQMEAWDERNHTNYTMGTTFDTVGWFCWNPAAGLMASSHASNRNSSDATTDSSNYVSTGVTSTKKTAETDSLQAKPGDTVNITFSHNIYSAVDDDENHEWTVSRYVYIDNTKYGMVNASKYTISGESSRYSNGGTKAEVSGTTKISTSYTNPAFIATTRNYTDGKIMYVHRDFYTVKFIKQGEYKFCETIYGDGNEITTACSKITVGESGVDPEDEVKPVESSCAEYQPSTFNSSDKYGGTTSSYSSIKSNVFTSKGLQSIYAKPTDSIEFFHCYFPGAQATRKSEGSHTHPSPSGGDDEPVVYETSTIGEQDAIVESTNYFDIVTGSGQYLQNGFTFNLSSNGSFTQSGIRFTGKVGETADAKVTTDSVEIKTSAVNQTISQGIQTNKGSNSVSGHSTWTWTYTYTAHHSGSSCYYCGSEPVTDEEGNVTGSTCKSCDWTTTEIGHGYGNHLNSNSNNNWYDVSSNTSYGASSSAEVYVPYNYITTGTVDFGSGTAYAGEKINVSKANITVSTRQNDVTQGNYATQTPNTTVTVYSFYSPNNTSGGGFETTQDFCSYYQGQGYSGCTKLTSKSSTFNNSYDMSGSNDTMNFGGSYNVHDVPAGYQFCIGISIFPAESGGDNISANNGKTYISTPTCTTVYKKPIFQVWGGSLYSNGPIAGNRIAKTNIDGYYEYTAEGGVKRYYNSWVEYLINGRSSIGNIASANASGYDKANLTADPGGISDSALCLISVLTISNQKCSNGASNVGNSGVTADKSSRDSFISYYIGDKPSENSANITSGSSIDLSNASSYKEANGIRHTYSNGSLTISASSGLITGRTHTITAESDITIESNLTYSDVRYTNIHQLPQYIIYSKGNIKISCNVSRIDAILIAEENIDTCYNGGDDNSQTRSNQLKINGIIIADSLTLGRTYGAGTGSDSAVPAEIINATPVNFYSADTDVNDTPSVYTTYLREPAPRY